MAWSLVASTVKGTAANGGTSSAINTTGADLIVIVVNGYNGGSITSVTDSKGNTYTQRKARTGSGGSPSNDQTYIYDCEGSTGGFTVGSSHTFTVNCTGFYPSFVVMAFSGSYTAGASHDVSNSGGGYNVHSVQGGSVTPTYANSLVVSGLGPPDDANTFIGGFPHIDSSFVGTGGGLNIPFSSGNYEGSAAGYKFNVSSAENPTWDIFNAGTVHDSNVLNVVYRPAGAATETGTGAMAFSGVAFTASGADRHSGTGTLAFGGVSFVGSGGHSETATGALALRGISFNASGTVAHTGVGAMSMRGIAIDAHSLNAGIPGSGLRQFWTF